MSIILPRTLDEKPKLSYSQYSSYKDEEYQNQYYIQYFSGVDLPSGEFAEFGTSCGQFIEDIGTGVTPPRTGCLAKEDVEIILNNITFPPNCVYEDKIIVDCGDFCIEGYIDRTQYLAEKEIEIEDFKTLNLDKKKDFYSSDTSIKLSYASSKKVFSPNTSKVLKPFVLTSICISPSLVTNTDNVALFSSVVSSMFLFFS